MTEIVKHQASAPVARPGGALSLGQMQPHDAWKFAEALAGSGLLPRQYQGNPASVLWALEYGRAIGLDVITTTQSVHVIQGRATASADLMASLTRRAGHRMRITGDDQRAEVVILRSDDPEFEFRAVWDVEKAQRAKLLSKDTWKQFPGAMLRARAISECVRMACPEVLHGSIYTPEELGARTDGDGMPLDAEVQQLRRVPAGEPDPWAAPAQSARDFVTEARTASDADAVRLIWQEAKAAGLDERSLGHIAAVGKSMTAEPTPKPKTAADGAVDAEVVEDPDDPAEADAQAAEAELREWAADQGIDDIDRDAEQALTMPLSAAPAEAIRGLLTHLRAQTAA